MIHLDFGLVPKMNTDIARKTVRTTASREQLFNTTETASRFAHDDAALPTGACDRNAIFGEVSPGRLYRRQTAAARAVVVICQSAEERLNERIGKRLRRRLKPTRQRVSHGRLTAMELNRPTGQRNYRQQTNGTFAQ
jgi:hypothetical protein